MSSHPRPSSSPIHSNLTVYSRFCSTSIIVCETERDRKENCFSTTLLTVYHQPPKAPIYKSSINPKKKNTEIYLNGTHSPPSSLCSSTTVWVRIHRWSASYELRLNGNLISWGYGSLIVSFKKAQKISLFIRIFGIEAIRHVRSFTCVRRFLRILSCAHNWITHIHLCLVPTLGRRCVQTLRVPWTLHRATELNEHGQDDVKIENVESKQTIKCNNIYSMILGTFGCRLEADADPSTGFGPAQLSPPPSSLVSLSSTFWTFLCWINSCTKSTFFVNCKLSRLT